MAWIGLALAIFGVASAAFAPTAGLAAGAAALTSSVIALARPKSRRGVAPPALTAIVLGFWAIVIAVVFSILAAAGSPTQAAPPTNATSGESPQLGAAIGDPGLDAEINDAVDVVGTYWEGHFSDFYQGGAAYMPPNVGGSYTSENPPSCGGDKLESFNAYYCVADNTLWWDAELMRAARDSGDAVIYLIVAHEWGHAIQAQVDGVWAAEELQADCFAAAALYGAEEDDYFTWEPGDTAEITNGLSALADETAWTSNSDHGDPLDRIDAFNDGRVGGVAGCFPIDE